MSKTINPLMLNPNNYILIKLAAVSEKLPPEEKSLDEK